MAEAESAPADGWDFSWLDGRATEQRPSWGYQRQLSGRLANATAALDLETGGGEVLAGAGNFPPTMVATESWPPNLALAAKLLHPLGVVVGGPPPPPRGGIAAGGGGRGGGGPPPPPPPPRCCHSPMLRSTW
ncbi:hypothetical protein LRC484719_35200 [Mycobacterium riyadhense]